MQLEHGHRWLLSGYFDASIIPPEGMVENRIGEV
jgi:hypothetical protein